MKKLKNVVVGAVLCTAFGMNLNYAAKGYGTAFADVAGTTAPHQYECGTDDSGNKVMCNSREASSMAYITCPYYKKSFFAKVKLPSGVARILNGPVFEGWSSLILAMDCPDNYFNSSYTVLQIWSESSSQPAPAPIRNVECEYDNNKGGQCTIIHKDCSDLQIDSPFS